MRVCAREWSECVCVAQRGRQGRPGLFLGLRGLPVRPAQMLEQRQQHLPVLYRARRLLRAPVPAAAWPSKVSQREALATSAGEGGASAGAGSAPGQHGPEDAVGSATSGIARLQLCPCQGPAV